MFSVEHHTENLYLSTETYIKKWQYVDSYTSYTQETIWTANTANHRG